MPYGYGASNRERGAARNRTQSTSTKKSSPSKTSTRPNPQTDSGSSKTSVVTSKQIKTSREKFEQATGESRLDNLKVQKVPAFVPGSTILNLTQGVRQKTLDKNVDFFKNDPRTKKARSKYGVTDEGYKQYMRDRSAGVIDAAGNKVAQRRDDRRVITQVQKAAVAQAPSGPTTTEVSQSTSAYGGERTDAQEALRVKKRGRKQTILTQSTGLGGSEPLITKKKLLG